MNRFAIALIAAAAAAPVSAQVYKCKDAGGTTVYSAQPCGAGAQAVDARPAMVPAAPAYGTLNSIPRRSQGQFSIREEAKLVWICQDGAVSDKTCQGGRLKRLDDLSASELNAYTKLRIDDDRRAADERKAEETREKAERAKAQAENDAKEAALKKLCGRFLGEDAVVGMTEEQFNKCSWEAIGTPTKNFTETAYGKTVQYVYKTGSNYRFYYFRNGVLTAKQN